MKTSDAFPSNYLKAADLEDREWNMTIKDYQMEDLQSPDGRKQTKPVLYFQRTKKGLVLNITNSRRIEHVYGSEMDDWIGKTITLFVTEVEARGETVNAIRVRVPQLGQSTAPSRRQPRPGPEGFTSGLPDQGPAPRRPAAEHAGRAPAYSEANPPPNTGQGYRQDMDDEPF